MGILLLSVAIAAVFSSASSVLWNPPAQPGWPELSPYDWPGADMDNFVRPAPWSDPDYVAPYCFHVEGSPIPFDAQADCPLCKGLTESTPGFAANPDNCQEFYMCVEYDGVWTAYEMKCPNCTFWNQNNLTCDTVQVGCDAPTAMTGKPTHTPEPENKLITCITFEDSVQGLRGIYTYNDGVSIVEEVADCVYGMCGYFNGSARLEVPRFSNSWLAFSEFTYSLYVKRNGGSASEQGVLSNDCYDNQSGADGNSLYVSSDANAVNSGLKSPDVESLGNAAADDDWHHVAGVWDGANWKFYVGLIEVDDDPFAGPIRPSPEHCPLVIGSYILPRIPSYFNGYMDEICFYSAALSADQLATINSDHEAAYSWPIPPP